MVGRNISDHNVRLVGQFFNKIKRLKYLGSAVENNERIVEDVSQGGSYS